LRKFKKTQDERILSQAFRLLEIETEDIEVYKLNEDQKKSVSQARKQIKDGQFLTNDEANNEIDEWQNK
jgi:ABC-type lipoprotein export system ATPase subunit